jgi:hypothetical protein
MTAIRLPNIRHLVNLNFTIDSTPKPSLASHKTPLKIDHAYGDTRNTCNTCFDEFHDLCDLCDLRVSVSP